METYSNNQDSSSDQQNKAFTNLSEEISFNINKLRFRSKEFMQNMASHIHNNNDPLNLQVNFPQIQKSVSYYSADNLTKFVNFLQENMITNQILQDFTFPPKRNEEFINGFSSIINQNKSLGLFETPIKLKLEVPSKYYYGYYLEQISIKSIESLLGFMIFEEYIILTTKMQSSQSEMESLKPDFLIEYNDNKPIDYIPFLSNIYNTILIYPEQLVNNNENSLYNLYILLLSEIIDENVNTLKKEFRNRTSTNLEIKMEKKQKNLLLSTVGNVTKKIPLVPEKYKNLWSTHLQIPMKSIERLVKEMDTDNDMKVTLNDIISFSHRKYIHLNEEVNLFILLFKYY